MIKAYKDKLMLIILASLGGAIELYDFILFAMFSTAIGSTFLPTEDKNIQVMAALAAFTVGYLARPLGGIIFGHFGDKYTRKKVFVCSVSIIGAVTLSIGLLPGYDIIGIWAPILLLVLRLIQGFAIGGEVPGAITFAVEHIPLRAGFACGCIYFFVNFGILVAGATKMLLDDAWRVAFIIGGLFAIISYFLRKKLAETEIFQRQVHRHKIPFLSLLKKYPKNVLLAIFIAGGHTASISLLFLYTTPHMELMGFDKGYINSVNMISTLVMAVFCLAGGTVSDYVNKRYMIIGGFLSLIPVGWFFFHSIYHDGYIFAAYVMVAMVVGGVVGAMGGYLAKLFSTDVRYSGLAVCYNLGFAIFGGLGLFLTSWYVKVTQDNMAPFYALAIILSAASIAAFLTDDSI